MNEVFNLNDLLKNRLSENAVRIQSVPVVNVPHFECGSIFLEQGIEIAGRRASRSHFSRGQIGLRYRIAGFCEGYSTGAFTGHHAIYHRQPVTSGQRKPLAAIEE